MRISLLHWSGENSIFARGLFPTYHQSMHNVIVAWLHKSVDLKVTTVLVSWFLLYNQEEEKSHCRGHTALKQALRYIIFSPWNSTKTSQQTTSFEPLLKPRKDNQTFLNHCSGHYCVYRKSWSRCIMNFPCSQPLMCSSLVKGFFIFFLENFELIRKKEKGTEISLKFRSDRSSSRKFWRDC